MQKFLQDGIRQAGGIATPCSSRDKQRSLFSSDVNLVPFASGNLRMYVWLEHPVELISRTYTYTATFVKQESGFPQRRWNMILSLRPALFGTKEEDSFFLWLGTHQLLNLINRDLTLVSFLSSPSPL